MRQHQIDKYVEEISEGLRLVEDGVSGLKQYGMDAKIILRENPDTGTQELGVQHRPVVQTVGG
jgi:hypothetical protein